MDAVDEVARKLAADALEGARLAWEGVGAVLREIHALRDEVHAGFAAMRFQSDPPSTTERPWGRRPYDPQDTEEYEEVTKNGVHRVQMVKIAAERFRRMEHSLADIHKKEQAALQRERDAALKEQGATELVKRWGKRAGLASPFLLALGGALWELVKRFVLKM
jgi:hypothetical protein